MKRPQIIDTFEAGDPIPEWLIAAEGGRSAGAPLVFGCACILLDTGKRHALVPVSNHDGDVVSVLGEGMTIFAPTVTVDIGLGMTFFGRETPEADQGDTWSLSGGIWRRER